MVSSQREQLQAPFQVMKMDHLIQHHDSLAYTAESIWRCHPFSIRKIVLSIGCLIHIWKLLNVLPIYCNDVDSSHSIWHYPNNSLLLHKVNHELERKSHEIVVYIQIYCTACMRQPLILSLCYSPDKCNTLTKRINYYPITFVSFIEISRR